LPVLRNISFALGDGGSVVVADQTSDSELGVRLLLLPQVVELRHRHRFLGEVEEGECELRGRSVERKGERRERERKRIGEEKQGG